MKNKLVVCLIYLIDFLIFKNVLKKQKKATSNEIAFL